MRRPGPSRQQGFGLLAFVLVTAVVAFTFIVGFAGVMVRKEANALAGRQQAYVQDALDRVSRLWELNAYQLDAPGAANTVTAEKILQSAGVTLKHGAQVALSNVMVTDGLTHRSVVLYLPADSDASNPPDLAKFTTTGQFDSCTNAGEYCAPRVFLVWSSKPLQEELARETQARLARVASKAQSYFKARLLQDPERNVSVNYFRKPVGGCEALPLDLGCMDTYAPLVTLDAGAAYSKSRMAEALALTDEELFSAWGLPLEASNLQDSVTDEPPFTMVFRAAKPAGGFLSVYAVQPL